MIKVALWLFGNGSLGFNFWVEAGFAFRDGPPAS